MSSVETHLAQIKKFIKIHKLEGNIYEHSDIGKLIVQYRYMRYMQEALNMYFEHEGIQRQIDTVIRPMDIFKHEMLPIKEHPSIPIRLMREQAFLKAIHELDQYKVAVGEVLHLIRSMRHIDFNTIENRFAAEMVSAVPSFSMNREISYVKITTDCFAYLVDRRMLLIFNEGGPVLKNADRNIFMTAIELGSLVATHSAPTPSLAITHRSPYFAKLRKEKVTSMHAVRDYSITLWDQPKEPVNYTWFTQGPNNTRRGVRYEYVQQRHADIDRCFITNAEWEHVKRINGISVKHLKLNQHTYVGKSDD